MATVTVYQTATEGAALVEYHGNAFDVVVLIPEVLYTTPLRFRDARLALITSTHLVTLRNTAFQAIVSSSYLSPGVLKRADENGIIHVVMAETAALSAGAYLRVTARIQG